MIVAVPTAIARTSPELDTDATPAFEDAQLTVTPESTAPDALKAVAESCTFWPAWTVVLDGVTLNDVGGAGLTSAPTEAVTPSAMAVIVALPLVRSVTIPVPDTVATCKFDDIQATLLQAAQCGLCQHRHDRPVGGLRKAYRP